MSDPTPYVHFPGTAREALTFYAEVFGCGVEMFTLHDFNRTDGPADAIAHGYLTSGPVALFAADAVNEPAFRSEGLLLALLGTADTASAGSSASKGRADRRPPAWHVRALPHDRPRPTTRHRRTG